MEETQNLYSFYQTIRESIDAVSVTIWQALNNNIYLILDMFDFPSQKKMLQPILKHYTNHTCADCDTRAPTWASLDFGVFLCCNCSGAHRALGPTYTRVKSVTLDLWKEDWFACMVLGNEQLNEYWEADLSHRQKKPKQGASAEEIRRYVFEKYVKKRYVVDPTEDDPLSAYKKMLKDKKQKAQGKIEEARSSQTQQETTQQPVQNLGNGSSSDNRQEISLLQFDVELHPPPNDNRSNNNGQNSDKVLTSISEHGTSFTSETSKDNFVDFNTLVQAQRQGMSMANGHLHHSFSTQAVMQHNPINNHNLFQQQQNPGQWASPLTHQNYLQHPYRAMGHHSPQSHPASLDSANAVPLWKI